MPAFSSAQNFIINNSQIMETTSVRSGPTGIDILLEASCPEAAHDAAGREYPPRCFPGTRKQYIRDIVNWVIPTLGDTPAPVYWMKGPAGVGKSAVAQTCAEQLKDQSRLGAAFFFSINGRDKPGVFFPSIAYQLSTIHPPYRDLIDHKICHDKTLVKKSLSFQFRYLIDEPLRELAARGKGIGKRFAVIVDGLDECEGAEAQCEIIRIIASATSNGLCWAFFSRPEPHIEATFAGTTVANCYKVVLPISRSADGEIELYLRNGLENILKRRNTALESQWPSTEDMEILVDAAGGSFIYATTVIRFVNRVGSLGPQSRLRAIIDTILDRRKHDFRGDTSADAPFAELDAFYILILQRIPTEISLSVHLLLSLLCRFGILGGIFAANILGLSKDEFEAVCDHASAVVHFCDPGDELELDPTTDTSCAYTQIRRDNLKLEKSVCRKLGGRLTFYHKSFDDFLLDPARSGRYCMKGSEVLAKHLLKMHLDYDRTYSWEGSKLVLATGVTDSASSLSYPYTNEFVNSLIKDYVYTTFETEDTLSFSGLGSFGVLGADRDFRKSLYVSTYLRNGPCSLRRSGSVWGCKCRSKSYLGVQIFWLSLAEFNVNEFKLMVKRCKQANGIQRYYPKWPSRIKSLFFHKNREQFESAVYRVGHGEKSIFWYWEIDYELGHFRDFQTIDLEEGEKRFREEDFDAWPEWEEEYL